MCKIPWGRLDLSSGLSTKSCVIFAFVHHGERFGRQTVGGDNFGIARHHVDGFAIEQIAIHVTREITVR